MSAHLFALVYHLFPAYVVITIVLGIAGLSRGVRRSTFGENTLCFRRSRLLRLACVAFSLMFLWVGVLDVGMDVYHYVIVVGPGGDLWDWYGFLPLCIAMAFCCLWMAGPSDVCIDLDARVCHATRGWPGFPRRFDCRLNDTSTVYVYDGSRANYVTLRVQADQEYRFLLATADSMDAAKSRAQAIGEQLGLPLRVTTVAQMRQDIARKR